ncbi:MAG TPA: FliM/FliN family flagellar motor C-terminal domain-containing protein [Bryobacteraceae bacterium]
MNPIEILNRYESLPFDIEVDIGNLEMKIGEILGLKVGTVLPTGQAAGTPLTLRAGGAPIALVDVVAAADHLSARVKNMFESASAKSEAA